MKTKEIHLAELEVIFERTHQLIENLFNESCHLIRIKFKDGFKDGE